MSGRAGGRRAGRSRKAGEKKGQKRERKGKKARGNSSKAHYKLIVRSIGYSGVLAGRAPEGGSIGGVLP